MLSQDRAMWIFDMGSNSWTSKSLTPEPGFDTPMVAVLDDKVLLFAGGKMYEHEYSGNALVEKTNTNGLENLNREFNGALQKDSTHLFVFGGILGDNYANDLVEVDLTGKFKYLS